MLTHRGFSAWIVSDGMVPFEFKKSVDHSRNVVTCWIPCKIGKKFTIHWRDDGTLVDSAAYIYLDEFEVPGYFLFGFGEAHRSAARVGPILERPFVFSKADEDIGPYPWHPESGGVVQLAIKQVKRVGRSDPNASRQPPEPNKDGDGNPNNSLGMMQQAVPQLASTWHVEPHDPHHPEPYVTFEWRCRSLRYLVEYDLATLAEIDPEAADEESPPATPTSQKPTSPMNPSPSPSGSNKKVRKSPSFDSHNGSSEEGVGYKISRFHTLDASSLISPSIETPESKPDIDLK